MSIASTVLLAFSMSADAFAVSLGGGARLKRPRLRDAMRIAAVFGLIEGLAPLAGWAAGMAASDMIRQVDHWIAFTLLVFVGGKMIGDSFDENRVSRLSLLTSAVMIALAAVATSIDAFAVGFSLAFAQIHIGIAALSIGAMTCAMVTIGILAGHYMGSRFGLFAERIGGLGLILIGTKILLQHLGFF